MMRCGQSSCLICLCPPTCSCKACSCSNSMLNWAAWIGKLWEPYRWSIFDCQLFCSHLLQVWSHLGHLDQQNPTNFLWSLLDLSTQVGTYGFETLMPPSKPFAKGRRYLDLTWAARIEANQRLIVPQALGPIIPTLFQLRHLTMKTYY